MSGTYSNPMKLCPPCAVTGGPEDVAAFARELRKVPPIRGML